MEISDYIDFTNELKDTLEAQYGYHMAIGDKEAAYQDVQNMMAYQVIARDDPRCSPKMWCEQSGASNLGFWDYNRTDLIGVLPKFLFCELHNKSFTIPVIDHWGIRVEGNYQGDIKISSKGIKINIRLMTLNKQADNAVNELESIFKLNNINTNSIPSIREAVKVGLIRVYLIEAEGVLHKDRIFGVAICKPRDDGKMTVAVAFNFDAILNCWVDIDTLIEQVSDGLTSAIGLDSVVSIGTDATRAKKKQSDMLSASASKDGEAAKLKARAEAMEQAREHEKLVKENKEKLKAKPLKK